MAERLLTTRQAAELLGVGPTSVKRWADDGRLGCVRTAGGHRRFEAEVVRAFANGTDGPSSEADRFVDMVVDRDSVGVIQGRLLELRDRHGSWPAAARIVGEAITIIGERWRDGRIRVSQEHAATERLHRAITGLADNIPVALSAPGCALVVAGSDPHALGLSLVELCARSSGWRTHWLGPRSSLEAVREVLEDDGALMVAASASQWSGDAAFLAQLATDLGDMCRLHGAALVLGGQGAWPDVLPYGHRLSTFETFAELLAEVYARGVPEDGAARRGLQSVGG